MPVTVGVRELRENLRAFLDRVQSGEDLVVTERGKPIARITPVESRTTLARLIAEGLVTPAQDRNVRIDLARLPRLREGTVADLLDEERREGY